MPDGMEVREDEPVFLKPETKVEPLVCSWYAWQHLISPVQFAMHLRFRLLPLLDSFAENPAPHLAASTNPAMYGGQFVSLGLEDVHAVRRLAQETREAFSVQLRLAEDLKDLAASLDTQASGYSLAEFYRGLPPTLSGRVECVYDSNHHASVRLFEALFYDTAISIAAQQVSLQLVHERERHFFMSTPRLGHDSDVRIRLPFRDKQLDRLSSMRTRAAPLREIADLFENGMANLPAIGRFFTPSPPLVAANRDYLGEGIRIRYFGHACVLFQTSGFSILVDPFFAIEQSDDGRFTVADVPDTIDYVILTHAHQDHFSPEMLLEIRHRVGRIVVPSNNCGCVTDPSMKLSLQELGFAHIDVLEPLDAIKVANGEIASMPFTGEHADLNIYSKQVLALTLKGRTFMLLVDSDGVDRSLYQRIMHRIGRVDALFIGMECHGAPLTWLYEPLLGKPVSRRNNESRRLSGSNCERAWDVLRVIQAPVVFVYAMGQEPWMGYVTGLQYTPDSVQLIESHRFLEQCERAGIAAERLFCRREIEFEPR